MGEAIPEKYKAAIYDDPGTISTKVVEKDVPEPAAGDVLIKLYVHPILFLFHIDFTVQSSRNFRDVCLC